MSPLPDFDFSTEFNRAIEEKVRAEQEALKQLTRRIDVSHKQKLKLKNNV